MYRIKGLTWWPEELPSEEEMQNGIKNLEKHNWKVDYVITHCASNRIQEITCIDRCYGSFINIMRP